MSYSEYQKALALGLKEVKACRAKVISPYLPVLDEMLEGEETRGEVPLGLVDLPIELIVGTKSAGRQRAFSRSFYPLLEQGSELATKWSALCDAHLSSGINDPIQVYEYLHDFYVQEGHKRVSVLRYFGAVTVPAMVTRILPPADGSLESQIYEEYLAFYELTGIQYLWFTETGSFRRLQTILGKAPGEEWSPEERREFFLFYHRFLAAYDAKSAKKLMGKVTPGDALLMLMGLLGYPMLKECSAQELKTTLTRLRNELYVFAELPVPETPVKKLLHTLTQPVKAVTDAVADAMTETAETMVEMADILAEPVKEMVEGDPDRDGNHSERGRKE